VTVAEALVLTAGAHVAKMALAHIWSNTAAVDTALAALRHAVTCHLITCISLAALASRITIETKITKTIITTTARTNNNNNNNKK
jgi:hypothetical protein